MPIDGDMNIMGITEHFSLYLCIVYQDETYIFTKLLGPRISGKQVMDSRKELTCIILISEYNIKLIPNDSS